MLTWALAWMAAQMARAGKGLDELELLLFVAIVADALMLGFGTQAIIEGLLKCP